MTVAKLGEAGKWHVVRVKLAVAVFTACQKELGPFSSSLRNVKLEIKEGEPTCKHCIRFVAKECCCDAEPERPTARACPVHPVVRRS